MYAVQRVCTVLGLHHLVVAQSSYRLIEDISPSNFFDTFTFYSSTDPTNGFVQYVNESYAEAASLISTSSNHVTIGVDTTHVYNSATNDGRPSVRLEGKRQFTHGLVILSLNHMPCGCATWPAFWSYGPAWPQNGEIDIIEGVNTNSKDLISLHTSDNCTVAGVDETGSLLTSDCFWEASANAGCSVQSNTDFGYGEAFNAAGGGVYAMEWTSAYIRVWFWQHEATPSGISSGQPDPATFGTPIANFQGSCDIDSHFADHHLVFDTTFCGDYAGNTYGGTMCPMTSGATGYQSCKDFVANSPAAFDEAYWEINWLRLYQQDDSTLAQTTQREPSLSSATPIVATSPIRSSLVSAGMAKHSSNAKSQSLVIPSTLQPTSEKTYRGPNRKSGPTSEAKSTSTSFKPHKGKTPATPSTSSTARSKLYASGGSLDDTPATSGTRVSHRQSRHTHRASPAVTITSSSRTVASGEDRTGGSDDTISTGNAAGPHIVTALVTTWVESCPKAPVCPSSSFG